MSKFEELRSMVEQSRLEGEKYRYESIQFASKLISEFIKFLEIPNERLKVVPLDKTPVPADLSYTVSGALNLGDDAFWDFGITLDLTQDGVMLPKKVVLLRIQFKKTNDCVIAKLGNTSGNFELLEDDISTFIPFFNHIYSSVRGTYEGKLDRFLRQDEIKKIGF